METVDDKQEPAAAGGAAWLTWLAGLLALGCSVGGGVWFMRTRPQADRKPPEQRVPLVEVLVPALTNAPVTVESMGLVMPSREVALQAEVGARVEAIHPMLIEGGVVRQGDVLLRLDRSSFEAARARQLAALGTAEANLRLEQGQQDVARLDLETMRELKLAEDVDRALALREPQLAIARAAVASARAALDDAELNLARTSVAAPFDAVVVSADAEQGGRASPGVTFARLAASDAFWVRAAVPVARLGLIRLPDAQGRGGAPATVALTDGRERRGRVIRRLPDVESDARMARVMVEVRDPLGLAPEAAGAAPLLLNDYVRVRIEGEPISGVYRVPRTALRDGRLLWLLTEDGRLQILPVEVVWGDVESVLVRMRLPAGARLVLSDLATPVEGMRLRVRGEGPTPPAAATGEGGPHA